MNNTNLNEVLAYILKDASDGAKTAGKFVLDQAPDIARQFLQFEFYSRVFFILFLLVAMITCIVIVRRISSSKRDKYGELNEEYFFLMWMLIASSAACFIFIGVNTYNCIKVSVAPKIVLIEKAAELMRKSR